MHGISIFVRIGAACAAVLLAASGQAQAQASGQAGGAAEIELGATQPSSIETSGGASARSPAADYGRGPARDDGGIRLALQLRLDAINTLSMSDPTGVAGAGFTDFSRRLLVPVATPGVRILDDALFLGLGFGFAGASSDDGPVEESRSGFSVSPLASYDVLADDTAALSLLGWINLASMGETEQCGMGGCADQNDDAFGWGLSLGAGLRGFITPSLALGGELGWGFLSVGYDNGPDVFVHGIFGNLFLEASLGL